VAFDTVVRAEETGSDLTLIDTAGRLHTSADLMRELVKVQRVTQNRSKPPVKTLLVLDATTGQNGLSQAREFNSALTLDALALTKLDGTAKGGIAVAVAKELGVPIVRIGVGEGIDDLRPFVPAEFAQALVSS
jgi:fused signal recognition particle receptor